MRERAIARILPPINGSISAVSKEVNIPYQSLNAWRTQSGKQPRPVTPVREEDDQLDMQSKFTIVLETATLNDVYLAAYCRSNRLYVEQITLWLAKLKSAFGPKPKSAAEKASAKRIDLLARELAKKEKALAEAAALMILRNKAEANSGLGEESRSGPRITE